MLLSVDSHSPRLWSADAPLFLRHYDGERLGAGGTGIELDGVDAARLGLRRLSLIWQEMPSQTVTFTPSP
jgi:hypothetical protein